MYLPHEKRQRNERVEIELPGKLFVLAEEVMIECLILNLCSSGAGLRCKNPPLLLTYAELHTDGFGHFECVTSMVVDGILDVRFVCRETRRRRLLGDIKNFVDESARLRQRENMPSSSEIRFTRPNGEQFRCGIHKWTSQGLLLRTSVRPPLGETVYVGLTFGRVAFHSEYGIAIEFLRADSNVADPAI